MILFSTVCIYILGALLEMNSASPVGPSERAVRVVTLTRSSFDLPIRRTALSERLLKRGAYSGSTGLGDFLDGYALALYHRAKITNFAHQVLYGPHNHWKYRHCCHSRYVASDGGILYLWCDAL